MLLCATTLLPGSVQAADILFDNADSPQFTTTRADQGIAAYLQVGAANVTVSQIAIDAAPATTGQMKFVIFSDGPYPGNNSGSLLFSDSVNVTASASLGYVLSDALSFTLQAGQYYDIGAIFSGSSATYAYDLIGDTQGGLSSIPRNQNIGPFANPVPLGHGLGDADIRLYGASTTTVPEPATFSLLGIGCTLCLLAAGVRKSNPGRSA